MKKKVLALSLVAAMCFGLVGCSFSFGNKVSSASDVIEKYNEQMQDEANYHVDMDMSVGISANAYDISFDIPIDLSVSADVLDGNLHGDMDMSTSFMNRPMESSGEIYVESGKRSVTVYTYDSDDGYWTVSDDDSFLKMATVSELDADIFEDAVLEYDKDKGTYIITLDFADFLESDGMADSIEEFYGSMAETASMDPNDILDQWGDADVTYVFNKEFQLLSISVDGCEYSDTVKDDGVEVLVSASFDLSFEFSDYGEIEERDVEVPKKIKESAVPKAEIDIEIADSAADTDLDYDFDYDEVDPGFVIDGDDSVDPDMGVVLPAEPLDPGFMVRPSVSDDKLGSYNGVKFCGAGDPWEDTFGGDGWTFDNMDGEFIFMSAVNEKYPGAELHVFNYDRENTTRSDIINYGVYSYEIDCAYASRYPAMTWNGLTFGASADDVMSAYGSPDYSYEGSLYTTYEYNMPNNMVLTFYVYPGQGLLKVNFAFWGV